MYTLDAVRQVHLEPTTRCNAACPMCARNSCGTTAPGLELTSMSPERMRATFPPSFLAQLDQIDLCGAYGDPAAAPALLELLEIVRSANRRCAIDVFSNGGLRSPAFWRSLAGTIAGHGGVVFAIDGLADTNDLYRRNVDFDRVMDNARAFIDAGGRAQWDFIAFRHNEHQVEEARALSEKMGFARFVVKKTARFLKPTYDRVPELDGHDDLTRFPVYSTDGTVIGHLRPPEDQALVNPAVRGLDARRPGDGAQISGDERTTISCRSIETSSIFVAADSTVYPCCWTYVQATTATVHGPHPDIDPRISDLLEASGGPAVIDASEVGLQQAVEGDFFAALERSWSCASVRDGQPRVCVRTCGTGISAYTQQFPTRELVPGSRAR